MSHPNRKTLWLIGGAAAILVVIAYFAFGNFPPTSEDLSGTIGGVKKAEKYQSTQMSNTDVVLTDSQIQTLLQDDKIQRLITNTEFKALMANPALREALANPEMQQCLARTVTVVWWGSSW